MQPSMTSSGRAEDEETEPRFLRRWRARGGAGIAFGAFAVISAAAGGASATSLGQVSLDEGLTVDVEKTTKPNAAYYDYINRADCINGFHNQVTEGLEFRFKSSSQSTINRVVYSLDGSDCCPNNEVQNSATGKTCFSIDNLQITQNTITLSVYEIINACATSLDVPCLIDTKSCSDVSDSRDLAMYFVSGSTCVGDYKTVLDLKGPSAPSVSCILPAESELTAPANFVTNELHTMFAFCADAGVADGPESCSDNGSGGAGGGGGSGGMAGSGGMNVMDPGTDIMAVIPGPGTGGAGGAGGTGGTSGTDALPCTPVEPSRDKAILLDMDDTNPIPALQTDEGRNALLNLQCGEPRVIAETDGNQVSVVATHLPWTDDEDDTKKLQNQHRYIVRVAGLDRAGNYGKLSEPQCSVPFEVKGIGDAYAEAGGVAGCNCSIPHEESDLAAYASGGLVAAAALLVRRRSAPKKPKKKNDVNSKNRVSGSGRQA